MINLLNKKEKIMVNTIFDSVWRDISPFAVGFDRTFDTLSLLANSKSQNANYPPYNIRKLSDDQYTIELAVAGFDESDVDVEVTGENLTIKGNRPKEAADGLMHQGLAARNFERKFILSDDMVVKGAALSNGMLYIGMEKIIPEHRKPKKISLTSKKKLLG
jgi:molecular chaperone IbpA|tara:strand:+ start:2005 stop:2487 length:483 start_codon:yes stop_codon:yes gene_type:complete